MPFTIYLRQIREEKDVFVYSQLEFDGFLWPVPTPGLEFVVWDPDSYIFCSDSPALLRMLSISGYIIYAEDRGSVVGAPKFGKLFVPDTSTNRIVKALGFWRNPVEFVTIKNSS